MADTSTQTTRDAIVLDWDRFTSGEADVDGIHLEVRIEFDEYFPIDEVADQFEPGTEIEVYSLIAKAFVNDENIGYSSCGGFAIDGRGVPAEEFAYIKEAAIDQALEALWEAKRELAHRALMAEEVPGFYHI